MASFEAIFAMGYPVAFEASAEDRDTRGLISIAIISSFASGLTANCTLHPRQNHQYYASFLWPDRAFFDTWYRSRSSRALR